MKFHNTKITTEELYAREVALGMQFSVKEKEHGLAFGRTAREGMQAFGTEKRGRGRGLSTRTARCVTGRYRGTVG